MKLKDEVKEARIKEVTLELVAEEGMAGITMNRVAKMAGISASMIYTYFKNKTDLIEQIFMECSQKLKIVPDQIDKKDVPFKLKTSLFFQHMLDVKHSRSVEYRFLKNFMHSPYFEAKHHDVLLQGIGKPIFGLLEEGRKYLIVKNEVDPFLLVALLDGFTEKLEEMQSRQVIDLDKQTIEHAFSIFWDGIRQ